MVRSARHLSIVACGLIFCGCQQPQSRTIDRDLVGEVMLHSEFAGNLRTLAMPGGRISGTPNADKAEQFVLDKCRAYGLQNVHGEPFELATWVLRSAHVTLLGAPPRELPGAIGLGRTFSTPPGGVTAELVDLGQGLPLDFAAHAAELRGRFAFYRDNREISRAERMALVVQSGAAGLVAIMPPDRAPIIGTGHATPRAEPGVVIAHDQEILDALARGEHPTLRVELETDNWIAHPRNIVAEIPGHGPLANEVVLFGAHLDGWHLGEAAMDNGSGSAVLLEAARALAAVGCHPCRTLRFVWFGGEELGLCGSKAYVKDHAADLDRIAVMVNTDMPGAPRGYGVFKHPELKPLLQTIITDLRAYELSPEIADWEWDASDHAPFMDAGIPALSLHGELGPGVKFYHTAGDTYDSVDRRGTVQSAAVLAVTVRRLADCPTRPGVRTTGEVK
jgi:carboxypeptidase Q